MTTPTGIEAQVCIDICQRQQRGIAKYGETVAESKLDAPAWGQHAYEEMLDAAIYLKRLQQELANKRAWHKDVEMPAMEMELETLRLHAERLAEALEQCCDKLDSWHGLYESQLGKDDKDTVTQGEQALAAYRERFPRKDGVVTREN